MWAVSVLLIASLLAPSVSWARAAEAVQAGAADDVAAAMRGFLDALNRLDVEGMSAYFAPNVTAFVPVAQAERVEGKEALVAIFRAFVERTRPSTPRLNIAAEDQEVVREGALAVVTFSVRDKAAGVVRRRTVVWERREGHWLIRHMHASDLAPPRPAP
jgi:ketosteroid isomerase-like protein